MHVLADNITEDNIKLIGREKEIRTLEEVERINKQDDRERFCKRIKLIQVLFMVKTGKV